jgi:hypothetical protein
VLERVTVLKMGSIWKVNDRRDLATDKLLLVPSKIKPWPVLLEILANHNPSPIRLRNGKVGLLISSVQLVELKSALRNNHAQDSKLDALTGFTTTVKTNKSKIFIVFSIIIFCVLLATQLPHVETASSPITIPAPKNTSVQCAGNLSKGLRIPISIRTLSKIKFQANTFIVASAVRFGGLTQVKLKRSCDGKYFRFDAWKGEDYLEISRLY